MVCVSVWCVCVCLRVVSLCVCVCVCVCVYSFSSLQCFAVRSLGWVEMAEDDLAPGKSSVAVNNCIRQLSYSKNDIRDTVGIWGEVCVCVCVCVFAFVCARWSAAAHIQCVNVCSRGGGVQPTPPSTFMVSSISPQLPDISYAGSTPHTHLHSKGGAAVSLMAASPLAAMLQQARGNNQGLVEKMHAILSEILLEDEDFQHH